MQDLWVVGIAVDIVHPSFSFSFSFFFFFPFKDSAKEEPQLQWLAGE
jgi:hypothetical protein